MNLPFKRKAYVHILINLEGPILLNVILRWPDFRSKFILQYNNDYKLIGG